MISRTGYVIQYGTCSIIWGYHLQTEIALLTKESKYIILSQLLYNFIPLIKLLRELKGAFPFDPQNPVIHCTLYEDNKGYNNLVELPQMKPQNKQIAFKYHHFRSTVKNETISVRYLESPQQIADIFTKPLNDTRFGILWKMTMGW